MLDELLATLRELVFGSVEGLSVAVAPLVGTRYLWYLKNVGTVTRRLRLMAVVVAVLMLIGVLEIGAIMELIVGVVRILGSIIG